MQSHKSQLPTNSTSISAQQTNSTMTSSTSNKRIKTTESARDTNATTQNRLLVPIATATKDTKGLDLRSMTAEDLKLLQKKDPFLYYSIPEIHKAEISFKEVDYSSATQSAYHVRRKTRVSCEGHTTMVMDELFGDELDGLEHESLGELDDLLATLFFKTD
mmetsp:Transcript_3966/g.8387  ORF Transcript_3966/g.8387 Transcript_3966/m.8387 type:complete len:161 (+) Transcript_3966:38-520(+)